MISKEQDKIYNAYMALVHEYQGRAIDRYLEMIRWSFDLTETEDPEDFIHPGEEAEILNCVDIHELDMMIDEFDKKIHSMSLAAMSRNL